MAKIDKKQLNNDAINFLTKHKATIKLNFIECDYYFRDDKEPRNIYKFTIKRNGKQYSHKFGDSIYNTKTRQAPIEYDILACLQKYDIIGDILDFVNEYCYTINSKKEYDNVYKIYNDCKKEYKAIVRLFGDCLDELREIY